MKIKNLGNILTNLNYDAKIEIPCYINFVKFFFEKKSIK